MKNHTMVIIHSQQLKAIKKLMNEINFCTESFQFFLRTSLRLYFETSKMPIYEINKSDYSRQVYLILTDEELNMINEIMKKTGLKKLTHVFRQAAQYVIENKAKFVA